MSFEVSQLPISDRLKESFPKIKASCFIIANLDCNIIVHELNSSKKINTGTFDNILFSIQSLPKRFNITSIRKETNPVLGDNKLTLYEMINIFHYIATNSSYKYETKHLGIDVTLLNSAMSGYGCVFCYTSNGAKYIGILYGDTSKDEVFSDVKNIANWLNQFYVYDTSNAKSEPIQIPVLYGTDKTLELTESRRKILVSRNCSGKIQRTYRYKIITQAPVGKDDRLGDVFYYYDTFTNPVMLPLVASKTVSKANVFYRIYDSIHYIIFGSTKYKYSSQNTSE